MCTLMRAPKGAQADGSKARAKVAAALQRERLRKQEEQSKEICLEDGDKEGAPNPLSEGCRRLLSAVFSHTKAHATSAPMAWLAARSDGWLAFLHGCSHAPLDALMGASKCSRVDCIGQSFCVVNKASERRSRPEQLHDAHLRGFVASEVQSGSSDGGSTPEDPKIYNSLSVNMQSTQHT